MVTKNYVRGLTIRIFFLLVLMLLFCFSLVVKQWIFTSVLLLVLIIISIKNLVDKIAETNKKLSVFFQMVFSGDSSLHFPENEKDLNFKLLNSELNRLSEKISNIEFSRKREEDLYGITFTNLNVGILVLNSKIEVILCNPPAKHFLNLRSTSDYKNLDQRAPHFTKHLPLLRKQTKSFIEIEHLGEVQKWLIQRRPFRQEEMEMELFILENLQPEFENKEMEVSEKLMHTLTHEIMNSISPVTSLIDTLQLQLKELEKDQEEIIISRDQFNSIQTGARIIQKRSHGLVEFVERYAKLARLPRLKTEKLEGEKLLAELFGLLNPDLSRKNIKLHVHEAQRGITFRADKQLLLQALINLARNAAEAYDTKGGGDIFIQLSKKDGYNFISVKDEAGGVPAHLRKDIFLPFFSTKEKGSGIGLSLSRKIVQAHQGRLYYKSSENGAEFCIDLPD